MRLIFFSKKVLAVGEVEGGKVEAAIGIAVPRGGKLVGDLLDGAGGVIFHDADADAGAEDDDEEAMFVNVHNEHAGFFALLIDAVEIRLVDEAGDGLVGHERAGRERANGGHVELRGIALMRDEKAALVNDQGGGGIRLADEFTQRAVEPLHILLEELRQIGHVTRAGGRLG